MAAGDMVGSLTWSSGSHGLAGVMVGIGTLDDCCYNRADDMLGVLTCWGS